MSVPNEFNQKDYESGRKVAMGLGGAVYIGVIMVATTLNISFILLALPGASYLARFILIIGGILVGLSMLAFPVAIHNWAVASWHRWVALFLYYGEMVIVGINTIVAFSALMYKFGGLQVPDWIGWYEPYTIGAIIYTLVAWGTLWVTDPRARQKAKMLNAFEKFNNDVADNLSSYLGTVEGKAAIQQRADQFIDNHFRTLQQGPVYWNQPGQKQPALPQNQPTPPALPIPPQFNWNLEVWARWLGMSPAQAYNMVLSRPDTSEESLYNGLRQEGLLPVDISPMTWRGIYTELISMAYPVRPPSPVDNANPPKGSVR